MNEHKQGLVDIGRLVLRFARVDRVTLHEDGITPESDTDHTVMLSVCACALADALYKDKLDIGKVAQFAIVHDLVEAYAGDTDTFNISDAMRVDKERREHEAFEKIQKEFADVYPWIATTIQDYESLSTDEAQFVKMVDKVMTKLTHRINHGAHLKAEHKTKEETLRHYGNQADILEDKYGKKFPEVIKILRTLTDEIIQETYV
jgi:5'-deoxynucleotidase YfbR-like HD superfamily hydrolase